MSKALASGEKEKLLGDEKKISEKILFFVVQVTFHYNFAVLLCQQTFKKYKFSFPFIVLTSGPNLLTFRIMLNFDLFQPSRVLGHRILGADAFVLTVERRHLVFRAGQHVGVGLPGEETREYSIFSGQNDETLEILVRVVPGGRVSTSLSRLRRGDLVQVRPPRGSFTLADNPHNERLVLISTGTGISPYRSFLRSTPGLDYLLVHGIRNLQDDWGHEFAPEEQSLVCVSRQPSQGQAPESRVFQGRVTGWLAQAELDPSRDRYFLCGNSQMIEEAKNTLLGRGVWGDRIHAEIYF
jgi:ferredoxin-NADP reductase